MYQRVSYNNYHDHRSIPFLLYNTLLMAGLFRQCFNRLVKDMKNSILRELNSNKNNKDISKLINENKDALFLFALTI